MRQQNRIEGQMEEMRIKLSSVVSDLLGVSAWRMLTALAEGETDAAKLALLPNRNCARPPNSYEKR